FLYAGHEMPGPAVAQVVTVHRGDHHVIQFECRNGLCQVERLVRIERVRTAMTDVAERAAPRTLVAHDHESRSALAEAFANVRAGRFLAYRYQIVRTQDILDFIKARGW